MNVLGATLPKLFKGFYQHLCLAVEKEVLQDLVRVVKWYGVSYDESGM
jgi:hypothetical protein